MHPQIYVDRNNLTAGSLPCTKDSPLLTQTFNG